MQTKHTKHATPTPAGQTTHPEKHGGVEDVPGNARDREMGRDAEPLGDRGHGHRTWAPPAGEQGMSNRPGDAAASTDGKGGGIDEEAEVVAQLKATREDDDEV